ncbi:MAG: hypothetical protein JRI23_26655 [Deltaproteobacteria bacterium]|jgi:hypothetical protein|nr:hypothetical protein [Deltaproteobacteria bacterium]MBW2535627.1 hypothetical protein [Deltaproteobacteria bacterium]
MRSANKPQVGALVSAIAAASCNGAQPAGPRQTPAPTVSVEPGSGTAMSAEPMATGVPADGAGADPRVVELRTRGEWRGFKALWRELDEIDPPEADGGSPAGWYGSERYARAIDRERADGLSKRLADGVAMLEQAKVLSADETAFLRQLANTRIKNMLQGSQPLMVMHRMPPAYASRTYGSVDRLEQRIDVLVGLRNEGQLSGTEYSQALADVEREAVTCYVLYELGREGYELRGPRLEAAEGERMLAEIERRVAAAGADAGPPAASYERVAKRAKALLPAVRMLIVELER